MMTTLSRFITGKDYYLSEIRVTTFGFNKQLYVI